MTEKQLDALEQWIVAIIKDEAPRSDGVDYQTRRMWRDVVEKAFALGDTQ